ncbi:MMPL family transporter [Streptomyces sp. NPDC056485]|uniref:MMPL family transporter n=1 Tax=Streptomyces sp. NPDC056485 TaxID=3345834 RepID=UPI0036B2391A
MAETPSTDAPANSPADATPATSLRTFTDAVIALTSFDPVDVALLRARQEPHAKNSGRTAARIAPVSQTANRSPSGDTRHVTQPGWARAPHRARTSIPEGRPRAAAGHPRAVVRRDRKAPSCCGGSIGQGRSSCSCRRRSWPSPPVPYRPFRRGAAVRSGGAVASRGRVRPGGPAAQPGRRSPSAADAVCGTSVNLAGPAAAQAHLDGAYTKTDDTFLAVTLAGVLLILLVVHRSVLMPLPVIAGALVALAAACTVLYALARQGWLPIDGQTQGIVFDLVIGASTDCALLPATGHREEFAQHADATVVMAAACRATVRPVLASTATIACVI